MNWLIQVRSGRLLAAALVSLSLMLGAAMAQSQTAPANSPAPEKVDQLLNLLDDPEVQTWLRARPAATVDSQDKSFAEGMSDWEALTRSRFVALKDAVSQFPEEFSKASNVVVTEVNSGTPGKGIAIVTLLIALGYGAEWLFGRALRYNERRSDVASAQGQDTQDGVPALSQIASLLVFSIASAGIFLLFDWPPLLRKLVLTYLFAFIVFRVAVAIGKILSAPGSGEHGPTDTVEADFWNRRFKIAAGYLLFAWATVSSLPALGFSADVVRLATYVFGLGLLALATEIVWRRRNPGTAAKRALVTICFVLLWLVWIAGMYGLLWLGIYALLLPAVITGADRASQNFTIKHIAAAAPGTLLNVLITRGVRALIIVAAVAWLANVWRLSPAAVAQDATLERLVAGLLNAVIILLVADLLWSMAKVFIARRLDDAAADGTETPEVAARRSRLRTLLPIFRNTLAVFILVVTALTILSGLGVQIGPLIAGAGIFGVAIGFGSQTLVKDVLSGVFYMLDDAFRVGEYIQSGSYKGTVESFSLRSVKLRHHRGPIFTVPFGDLGAVQNMSRDWVVDKMVINVTYDSDIDLARRLIKKIGLELAQDPEFAASTLQPLKMQGVDNFGDFAVVLRMKLMTKPGEQFGIKRRALLMIKKAFEENGIKIAVPTVQVSGGSNDAAAAASETMRMRKKAQAAAATAAG